MSFATSVSLRSGGTVSTSADYKVAESAIWSAVIPSSLRNVKRLRLIVALVQFLEVSWIPRYCNLSATAKKSTENKYFPSVQKWWLSWGSSSISEGLGTLWVRPRRITVDAGRYLQERCDGPFLSSESGSRQ